MRHARQGVGTVVMAGLLATLPLSPVAAAPVRTAKSVENAQAAWFFRYRQPAEDVPDVDDPTGNQVDDIAKSTVRDQTNVYRSRPDSLHVGVNVAQPEAFTYLSFPLLELGTDGLDAVIVGGTVTFTDAGRDFGSRRADAAEMVACRATELVITEQGGDWKQRYDFDAKARAPLKPVKQRDQAAPLRWRLDLGPFVKGWRPPAINHGLAIVPDPASKRAEPEQTWHVAFQSNAYQPDPDTPTDPRRMPITADLRYRRQTLSVPDFDLPSNPLPPADPGPGDRGGFDDGGGFGDGGRLGGGGGDEFGGGGGGFGGGQDTA
ncbi:MAG: hypothetical protein ACRDU8_08420, partial [Egibacteraceae bacterium]